MAEEKKSKFSQTILDLRANFLGATVEVITNECKNLTNDLKLSIQAASAAAIAGGRKVAVSKLAIDYNRIVSYPPLSLQGKVNMRRLTVIGLALLCTASPAAKAIVRKKLGAILPSEFASLDAETDQQKILKQAVIDSGLTDDNAGDLIALFSVAE